MTGAAAERCGHCGAPMLPLDCVHYPDRRGEADAGNPLLGSVIDGKFRLEGVLGRGGLGTVFQAVHIGSLMKVALKLLHPRFSERPEYRRALLPEARRAATVMNERCARLLDVGETGDGGTYLAMELVAGSTLDDVAREGGLRPSHAVDLLVQIAEALVAIHEAGLVHCDLAPRNVMVSVRGGELVAKVLDFGIARTVTASASERLAAGQFLDFGNPAFSAPEHLAGKDVDARADLYSLGALAWLMLTGKAPVEDRDSTRAARATIDGKLGEWPRVAGVPRRLRRLVERCLRLDPAERPSSAASVLRELRVVRGSRHPALQRAAISLLALGALAVIPSFVRTARPFLDPMGSGSLRLFAQPPSEVAVIQSQRLNEIQFLFGGFSPERLLLEVSREGNRLVRCSLRPEIDETGETLTLAIAQPEWLSAVRSMREGSRDEPVDLSFVVPGHAPLGSARIRLDDEAPAISVEPVEATLSGNALTGAFEFTWQVEDADVVERLGVVAEVEGRMPVTIPLSVSGSGGEGRCALGRELAARWSGVGDQGAVVVRVVGADRAGNEAEVHVASVAHCDLRAPRIEAVTGPSGQSFVPSLEGSASLRVQLSEPEAGCLLRITSSDGAHEYLRRDLGTAGLSFDLSIPIQNDGGPFATGIHAFVVEDAAGNRARSEFPLTVRDRTVPVQFLTEGEGLVAIGDDLVLRRDSASGTLDHPPDFRVARVRISSPGLATGPGTAEVQFASAGSGMTLLTFGTLPVGQHSLEVELEDVLASTVAAVRRTIPLRVLPDQLELRIPRATSRFLPDLTADGVLSEVEDGYRDGRAWTKPLELLPYLRGSTFVRFGDANVRDLGLGVGESSEFVLPKLRPLPGRTVVSLALRDVLGRPVRVLVGDVPAPRTVVNGQPAAVVADFLWHGQPPQPIGEELLVEHGQEVRLQLRLPLPYREDELDRIRLRLGPGDVIATELTAEGAEACVVTFVVPFATWGQLIDLPRDRYGEQIQHKVAASVDTPIREDQLTLTLRTTRSTLHPIRFGEFANVPAVIAAMRLVPVLGPDRPFLDPVPAEGPPRAVYRPQVSVAVRKIEDFLLQDRELTCGQARVIVERGLAVADAVPYRELVHADDPEGEARLDSSKLLSSSTHNAASAAPWTGVDFFQAYTCCRLLGLVVGGDPALFRLPTGTELELAALGVEVSAACNAAAARGRSVSIASFVIAAEFLRRGVAATAEDSRVAGDVAASSQGASIYGLDFGVREWVADLPHVPGEELILEEWNQDHEGLLAQVASYADGTDAPPPGLITPLRTLGVVRGLALGELDGLIDADGRRLELGSFEKVPASVPGVLRTEQLRRDGRDLLSSGKDSRLRLIGCRVAGTAALVQRIRGME